MSRTLTAGFVSHLDVTGTDVTHTLANMLRLDLKDGTTLAFTDHDEVLAFDLGDGAVDYVPDTGILPSDVGLSIGFTADDLEVTGPIGDVVTRTAVIGGRFDEAVVRLFQVNWSDLTDGAAKILKGRVVVAEVMGGRFKLAIHSEASKFAQTVGRTITAYCDVAEFGDARCGFTPATLSATVSAVTDERAFAVTFAGTYASGFFDKGKVQFDTGALAGTRPVEIFAFFGGAGAGSATLWTGLAEPPQIGDTLTFSQGCDKTRTACLAYDNVINFRGFPDVPGSDQVLRYPNPGS